MPLRFAILVACVALSLALPGFPPGRADDGSRANGELHRAMVAAERAGFAVLDAEVAEGRRIGKIHVIRDDVFVEDEPWPTFLNVFHPLTQEAVVRREMLLHPGDAWSAARAAETARNLRNIGIFSMVGVIPVVRAPTPASPTVAVPTVAATTVAESADATPTPPAAATPPPATTITNATGQADTIDIVVYTRDLWSLRLESSFSFNNNFLDRLSLLLVERNMFGRNMLLGASFDLLPKTISVGNLFWERRLFNTRLSLSQSLNFILNRETGALEGTTGAIAFGLPLWRLSPMWGFDVELAWNDSVGRQLQGANLLTWDNPGTVAVENVPRIWDRSVWQGNIAALRQFGHDQIHRLRFGYALSLATFEPHADTGLADLDPRDPERLAFEQGVLAESRRELYPFIGWEIFEPTWVMFSELSAFGIAEEIRVGPWSSAFFGAPLKTFGSAVDAITWRLSAGIVLAPKLGGDRALIDLMGSAQGRVQAGEHIDQRYQVRLRAATPRFFGRIALSADLEVRDRDSFRTLVTLGGDNGLRGYPSQSFFAFGADRFRFNLEWRSPPFVLGSVHFGGVLFYDAGGLGEVSRTMPIHHGVGAGLRLLFPQFNRFVFRLDVGVPLDGEPFTVLLSIGSTQLLPLTAIEDQKLAQ